MIRTYYQFDICIQTMAIIITVQHLKKNTHEKTSKNKTTKHSKEKYTENNMPNKTKRKKTNNKKKTQQNQPLAISLAHISIFEILSALEST